MRRLGIALLLGFCLASVRGVAEGCSGLVFQGAVRYAVSADEVVLVADLDGDGAAEIVTSGNHVDEGGAFSVLRNLGGGVFAGEQKIATGFGETLEQVADLDGDGARDLVASSYWQNGLVTYRGMGQLQFGSRAAFDTATHGGPTRAVDYDGDGVTDLVSFSFGSGNPVRVHLFHGRAGGTYDPKTTFDTDLAIAASPSTRVRDGRIEFLVGERSGFLGLVRLTAGGVAVSRLRGGEGFDLNSAFADVNDDGLADVVETSDSGWIFVALAKADGGFSGFQQLENLRRMTLPTELRATDLDRDGHVDLVVSDFRDTTVYFFRGLGTGAFAQGVGIAAGGAVNDLAIGDVDGDGWLDIVTANDDHSVSVIVNRVRCPAGRRRAVRH